MALKNQPDRESVLRVARAATKRGFSMRVAGEVRFIKDRGGDHSEWGWNPPGASAREIDPNYEFNAKNLEPLARVLRSTLMALGHIQTARTVFTKIKGQRISPDGNIGGRGYVMPLKDIRKQYANCDEALSAISDSIYDEMQATHWHPDVNDSGGDPRDRDSVKEIMDDVEEIKEDPEEWAEQEEAEMDQEGPNEADGVTKMGARKRGPMPALRVRSAGASAERVAALYLRRQKTAGPVTFSVGPFVLTKDDPKPWQQWSITDNGRPAAGVMQSTDDAMYWHNKGYDVTKAEDATGLVQRITKKVRLSRREEDTLWQALYSGRAPRMELP